MPVFQSIKDIVVGQALKLAGSPRVSKLVSDPRLMNAAMKVMSAGGAVMANMDKAGKMAASTFGLATRDEVKDLRGTITQLEDHIATLESRNNAPKP
jgi:hypothetical protein